MLSRYLKDYKGEISVKQLAQEIEDGLTPEVFNAEVAKLTRLEGSTKLSESTKKRLSYLARIPFRAIVTTNYNNLLDGYPSVESSGGTATAISQGALNPQHNFERILRPVPGERAIPSLPQLPRMHILLNSLRMQGGKTTFR